MGDRAKGGGIHKAAEEGTWGGGEGASGVVVEDIFFYRPHCVKALIVSIGFLLFHLSPR